MPGRADYGGQPPQAIVVNNLLHLYFRFVRLGSGWAFAGYYRPDYVIASHELGRIGSEPILKITEQPRGGTGLSMEVQRWFDLTRPDFDPVFVFTTSGNEGAGSSLIGDDVTAQASVRAEGALEV